MTEIADHGPVDPAGLRSSSRRGVVINYVAQFSKFGLQIVYSVLLARLLLPRDFGLVAMASPLLVLAGVLSDLGISQAIIQRERVSDAQLSFLFWANLIFNAAIMLILVSCAGLIGDFYREQDVAPILIAMALLMFLQSVSSQHLARLNRRLAFGTVAGLDLGTYVLAAAASLIAAWQGLGVWSIIVNQAVLSIVTTVSLWTLVRWRPGRFDPRLREGREMLGFGGNVAVFNIANYFARNLDKILIGRWWGEGQLGLYDRSYRLMTLPLGQVMGPISKVALPAMARLQGNENAYRRAFFALTELAMLIVMPLSVFCFVASEQIVTVLLGRQWVAAAPIFAVLAIGGPFGPLSNSVSWLLITQNRTAQMRNYGLVSSVGFVLAIIAGVPGGALGVATAYIAYGVVQGPVTWVLVTRTGPVSTGDLMRFLLPHILAGAGCGLAVFVAQRALPHGFASLFLLGVLAFAVFMVLILLQPRSRAGFLVLLGELDGMLGGRLGRMRIFSRIAFGKGGIGQ